MLHPSCFLVVFAIASALINAVPVTIKNSCDQSIGLYDNSSEEPIQVGGTIVRNLPEGFSGMFRAGINPQATLAEFALVHNVVWYDISIIPTGKQGPGFCTSLEDCKKVTGGTGFNLPMEIAPQNNFGERTCEVLTCLADGCSDAYNYPKDDIKTHTCPGDTEFVIEFCPDSPGSTPTEPTTAPSATLTPPSIEEPTGEPPVEASPSKESSSSTQDDHESSRDTIEDQPLGDDYNKQLGDDLGKERAQADGSALIDSSLDGLNSSSNNTASEVVGEADITEVQDEDDTSSDNDDTRPVQLTGKKSSKMKGIVVSFSIFVAAAVIVAAVLITMRVRRKKDQEIEEGYLSSPNTAPMYLASTP